MHTRGGGIKVYPFSKFFSKLVNKNALTPLIHQKRVPSQIFFTTLIYLPSHLAKTSMTLLLDFQTVCIYALNEPFRLNFILFQQILNRSMFAAGSGLDLELSLEPILQELEWPDIGATLAETGGFSPTTENTESR
jgi:hypothetical protein